jgi:hypothetical protein
LEKVDIGFSLQEFGFFHITSEDKEGDQEGNDEKAVNP